MSSQDANYWGKLINPDKSPAPPLEQLCFEIAGLVSATFESSFGTTDLTPDRLAAFYRQVGGNYDALFLETRGSSLSFIYQSLGCFHSLQPTPNAFEAPSIPALLPSGFVRWLTIQIVLDPDEHCRYLQNAVGQWDIADINGNVFPKEIPRDAFPPEPDADMVKWHEQVSRRLESDYIKACTPGYPPLNFNNTHGRPSTSMDPSSNGEDYFTHRPHRHDRSLSCSSSDVDSDTDAPPMRHRRKRHSVKGDYSSSSRTSRMHPEFSSRRLSSISPRNGYFPGRRFSLGAGYIPREPDTSSESSENPPSRPFFSDVRYDRHRGSRPHHLHSRRSHSHDPTCTRKHERTTSRDTPKQYYDGDVAYAPKVENRRASDSSSKSFSTAYSSGYDHGMTSRPLSRVQEYVPPRDTVKPRQPVPEHPPTRPHHQPRHLTVVDEHHLPTLGRLRGETRRNPYRGSARERARSANYESVSSRPERWTSPVRWNVAQVYVPVRGAGDYEYVGHGRRAANPAHDW